MCVCVCACVHGMACATSCARICHVDHMEVIQYAVLRDPVCNKFVKRFVKVQYIPTERVSTRQVVQHINHMGLRGARTHYFDDTLDLANSFGNVLESDVALQCKRCNLILNLYFTAIAI